MRWLLFVFVASVAGLQWTERRTAARRSAAVRPAAPHDEASSVCDRRSLALALGGLAAGASAAPAVAMGPESTWPLWPALPVAPYSRRKTIRRDLGRGVWAFDQMLGIYYVHVPIRMTVVKMRRGLFVYAPVAPTRECLALLQELIDAHGPVRYVVLPSVAVEHKVLAGPFAREFPDAAFYVCDQQYSFPLPLPDAFLGLPPWTQTLPRTSEGLDLWDGEFEHRVLTVEPGPGSYFQDAAFFHATSKTMLLCDTLYGATETPPPILEADPEYVRALLFHARDGPLERVADTAENRRKGWRRIVLLFNFFFPGASTPDLGYKPLLALGDFAPYGWRGWKPFEWKSEAKERLAFDALSDGGRPTILPIIQIIISRGGSGAKTLAWVDAVAKWDFDRVVPAHLDAELKVSPAQFRRPFDYIKAGANTVRFCDEDIKFLRVAEEGPLAFSVFPSSLGVLRGRDGCALNAGLFK